MSIDSVFVHKMWDDNELSKMVDGGIPFAMLSDTGGKVGKVYGIFDEDAGVENRGRFIIDPDGVVQGYEVLTPPAGSGFPACQRNKRQGSNPLRLEAGQIDAQAGSRLGRQGMAGLENRDGLRLKQHVRRTQVIQKAAPYSAGRPLIAPLFYFLTRHIEIGYIPTH
jgi:hypothetical protein